MSRVWAWQHIYTNVEQEQSPQGRGGFQTLLYSRAGLTETEVAELEGRLLYFPSEIEPVKRVFLILSTGRQVVASIVPLRDPDRTGRGGRYLAHSLVFEPEEFAKLEADPFWVWQHFQFVTTVEEALASGDRETGDQPPVVLERPEVAVRPTAPRTWLQPAWEAVVAQALRVGSLARQRATVALVGEPSQVEAMLEAVWEVLPIVLRSQCSFDTYFHRCNPVAAYYWAVGLPRPPMQHYAAVIDITAAPAPAPPEEERETCYQRWIAACLRAGEQERVVSERDQAWVFCQWLEGAGEGKALEGIPVPVVEAVVAANPQTLRERLRDALRQQIPAILVPHLADSLQRHAAALTLCQGIQAGFDERELAEALYLAYAERGGRRPPWRERRAVAWVVERTGTLPLQALLQCWTRQWKRLRHCLAMLDEAAYRGFIHLALTSAQARADQLVVGGRGESLLDLYLNDSRAGEEPLIALVGALLAHGEAACLARLVPLARRRPRQEVRTLLRIIHRQPGVPEAFRSALEQTLTAASGRRRGS